MREWLSHLQRAAELFSDEEILALSEDGAVQLVERLVVEPLVLLENEAYVEEHGSTRASVLVLPFTGDPDFFELDPRPLRSRSGLGTCRDRSVLSARTRCTSSSRTRRDCRRAATKWSRLDSLPCVTTYRVCDQRSSGSKPIYVMWDCGHLSTAASKPKSVAGPSDLPRCRSDDVTTRRRCSRRRLFSDGQDRTARDLRM